MLGLVVLTLSYSTVSMCTMQGGCWRVVGRASVDTGVMFGVPIHFLSNPAYCGCSKGSFQVVSFETGAKYLSKYLSSAGVLSSGLDSMLGLSAAVNPFGMQIRMCMSGSIDTIWKENESGDVVQVCDTLR